MFISDIEKLLAGGTYNLATDKYITENRYFFAAINEQKTSISYYSKEYKTSESLYEKNITPQTEYLQRKNAYDTAVSQMENIKEQFRNRWEAEKTSYEIENRELLSSIKQLEEEKTKYVLKAPASGAVIQFSGVQRGNFISPGQTIASISNDDNLLVECYISPIYLNTRYLHLDARQVGLVCRETKESCNS
ncbi:MAG: HlyD family efflux transporter periplasmic adaptor subunit [Tannerella sp.]|nr:HlyD family efflux transporter periplasmic adaptor subunit [Tannerella sp.]